jgi:PAS domain S-box-containing protein
VVATPRTPVDLARLVSQVADYAIIALDGSGTIQSWNAGAQQVKGYTADEAIGRNFSMFYTEEDRRSGLPLTLLAEARDKGSVEHAGWRVRRDGTQFWGHVIITALHDDAGNVVGFGKVTRDLTAQHELEESLMQSEERFRLLVSQVKDYAIVALDPSGVIQTWNAGALAVKGYSAEEAIGRSFSMFYTEEDRNAGLPLRLLEQARRSGRVEHTGWRVRRDGGQFWGHVVITALFDESERLTGFAKVTRDMTERKQFEDTKAAFLAKIAHDFRTPLAALKGFAELARNAPEDRLEAYLARIDANADRLLQMMSDLVDYARREAIDIEVHPENLDLLAVVSATVTALGSTPGAERVHVGGHSAAATTDRTSIERVVTNLVTNALKYSDEGPVSVTVSDRSTEVEIAVADHGRGIAPEDVATIFDAYERGRLADASDGGEGLGLSSAKDLIERIGGTIGLTSEPGVGTTVTILLPKTRNDGAA